MGWKLSGQTDGVLLGKRTKELAFSGKLHPKSRVLYASKNSKKKVDQNSTPSLSLWKKSTRYVFLWLIKHRPVASPQALFQQSWQDLRVGWYESGLASFSWLQSQGPEDGWWLPSQWPAYTKQQLSLIPHFKNITILQFQNKKCDSSTLYQKHQRLNKLYEASWYWFKQQDLTMQLTRALVPHSTTWVEIFMRVWHPLIPNWKFQHQAVTQSFRL